MTTLINAQFPEVFDILPIVSARDLQTAASDGLWLSPSDFSRFFIMFSKGIGTSGDSATVAFQQAQDTSGTGAEALNFSRYRKKEPSTAGVVVSETPFEIVSVSPVSNSFTLTAESEVFALWDLDDATMNADNFYLRATISSPSNTQGGCLIAFGQRDRVQGEDVVDWI